MPSVKFLTIQVSKSLRPTYW